MKISISQRWKDALFAFLFSLLLNVVIVLSLMGKLPLPDGWREALFMLVTPALLGLDALPIQNIATMIAVAIFINLLCYGLAAFLLIRLFRGLSHLRPFADRSKSG